MRIMQSNDEMKWDTSESGDNMWNFANFPVRRKNLEKVLGDVGELVLFGEEVSNLKLEFIRINNHS